MNLKFRKYSLLGDVLSLIAPLFIWWKVNIGGQLYGAEFILLMILPILLAMRGRLLRVGRPKYILLLGIAWFISQILTDLVAVTPFENLIRGWSKIIFLLTNFAAIYLLMIGNVRRMYYFAFGLAVGIILSYYTNPHIYEDIYYWKFSIGFPVSVLIMILLHRKRLSFTLKIMIILILSSINFYMDARYLGVMVLLTGVYISFYPILSSTGDKKINTNVIILGLVTVITSLYVVTETYSIAASQGYLGERAKVKFERQSSGVFGVLIGGRLEIFSSFSAIVDSPILGHGSWARNQKYIDILMKKMDEYGYDDTVEYQSVVIPTHSHLFGAWVYSGIMGAIFWLYTLIITIKAMLNTRLPPDILPLIAFIGFCFIWSILFSPFGAEERLYGAFYISSMIVSLDLYGHSHKNIV